VPAAAAPIEATPPDAVRRCAAADPRNHNERTESDARADATPSVVSKPTAEGGGATAAPARASPKAPCPVPNEMWDAPQPCFHMMLHPKNAARDPLQASAIVQARRRALDDAKLDVDAWNAVMLLGQADGWRFVSECRFQCYLVRGLREGDPGPVALAEYTVRWTCAPGDPYRRAVGQGPREVTDVTLSPVTGFRDEVLALATQEMARARSWNRAFRDREKAQSAGTGRN
jgi:hypothetical protein